MQHTEALTRLRNFFRRDETTSSVDVFSGPTLVDQEPDLAREIARHAVTTSGWAAGGHPSD